MASAFLSQLQLVSTDELPLDASCAFCQNEHGSSATRNAPKGTWGLAIRLICGHSIGANCVNKWLTADRSTCPRCKYILLKQDDDDEPIDPAFDAGLRSSFVAPDDPRSTTYDDQHTTDRPTPLVQSRNTSTDTPPTAEQGADYKYVPYRPPHYTPPSSSYNEAPPHSAHHIPQRPGYSHTPNRPSDSTQPAIVATRTTTTNTRHTAFIPSDFGLPPPMIRHSLAKTASPPTRNMRTSVPASLRAGQGGNIQTTYPSEARPDGVQASCLSACSPLTRLIYSPGSYIAYRPGSYSSVHSSSS